MDRVVHPRPGGRTETDEQVSLMLAWASDMGLIEWHMDDDGEWYFHTACGCADAELEVPIPPVPDYTVPQALRASARLIWRSLRR